MSVRVFKLHVIALCGKKEYVVSACGYLYLSYLFAYSCGKSSYLGSR